MKAELNEVEINGVTYTPKSSTPTGNRAVVVVDRGWIFAGDVTEDGERITLDRAVHVFRWEKVGFAAVVDDPIKTRADLRPMTTQVVIPKGSEIFRLPVHKDWGLK